MDISRLYIFLLLFVISCTQKTTFSHSLSKDQWNYNDTIIFTHNIDDIENTYRMSLFFRNTMNYSFQNIYLLIETHFEDQIISVDTLQYLITDKYGRWYGRGFGNTRDNYFMFEENKKFNLSGEYRFKLEHGMRQNPLKGVNKIGFKIEKND